jgi:serine/threonine protein kinase
MAVTDELVARALALLHVATVRELPTGGQKRALLVARTTPPAGEQVVLKVVNLSSSSPDALRRAQREVELLARLTDPHLVTVRSELVELGDPPDGVAWLEEFVPGEDLRAQLGSQWSWSTTRQLGMDVAAGLGVMHRVGVVHRDLSPGNVRLTPTGKAVVLDPGFARHTLRSGITVGGQPGTREHFSPEHLNTYSAGPSAASDVFCVGILMFMALTGQAPIPWRGDDADYIVRLSRVELDLDLAQARPDLNADQLRVMRRILHKQPARRFLNGERLATALEHVP